MAYLEQFDPPDLPPGASTLRQQLELGMVFHGRQVPPLPSTSRLLTMFVVTADKAAREYAAACKRVNDHMAANGGIQAYIEGVGHFENCINSVKRSLRALERLGTQTDGPVVDRTIRRLAWTQARAITSLRDAIEHMDADIVSPSGVAEGDPHLLTLDKQGVNLEIGTHRIPVAGLHAIVRSLYSAGGAMIQALPTPES